MLRAGVKRCSTLTDSSRLHVFRDICGTRALQSDARLTDELAKTAGVTWLPYTLIDQVLVAADAQKADLSPRARTLLDALRAEVASRSKRVQKFTQAMRATAGV